MTKHDIAHKLVHVQKRLLEIKAMSRSDLVDNLCIECVSNIVEVGDSLAPKIFKEISKRHADPML